jgi:hypothetical protein
VLIVAYFLIAWSRIFAHLIAVPGTLKESANPKEVAGYWKQFILAPMDIECNSVAYDEDLSCLLIDVKDNKSGSSLGDLAQSYWDAGLREKMGMAPAADAPGPGEQKRAPTPSAVK